MDNRIENVKSTTSSYIIGDHVTGGCTALPVRAGRSMLRVLVNISVPFSSSKFSPSGRWSESGWSIAGVCMILTAPPHD